MQTSKVTRKLSNILNVGINKKGHDGKIKFSCESLTFEILNRS
jgi:hypothetical protein